MNIGVAYPIAVASGRGINDNPANVRNMALEPNNPRQTWPQTLFATNPVRNSPRNRSHKRMIGIGIKDRKKTAWPTGTSLVASLTMPAITTNKSTAVILRLIAKTGRWSVWGFSIPLAAPFNARAQGEIICRDGKLVNV